MTVVAHTREELAQAHLDLATTSSVTAVVMTMGALHEGHVELIRQARRRAGRVIVTIFLNPLQFAPGEDLSKYPRTLQDDLQLCRGEGVDLVFAPTVAVVYPAGEPSVRISAGPVGDLLEGASRPGHFDGVLTVVAKLLHLTRPDLAYFGHKDAQQLWLIDRMVTDLDLPVEVVAVPTVRDDDGLALSSRNTYLVPADRSAALTLSRALRAGSRVAGEGAQRVLDETSAVLAGEPGVRIDYVALVDPESFQPPPGAGPALLLVAAFVGSTRLIDNMTVELAVAGEGG